MPKFNATAITECKVSDDGQFFDFYFKSERTEVLHLRLPFMHVELLGQIILQSTGAAVELQNKHLGIAPSAPLAREPFKAEGARVRPDLGTGTVLMDIIGRSALDQPTSSQTFEMDTLLAGQLPTAFMDAVEHLRQKAKPS